MKIDISKKESFNLAMQEGDAEIGAGLLAADPTTEGEIRYLCCRIYFDPKPIPDRRHDWTWVHVQYDGPPDNRCGTGSSIEACKKEIDAMAEELATLASFGG